MICLSPNKSIAFCVIRKAITISVPYMLLVLKICLVWVEALRPSQPFFSHIGTFSWVEPVLGTEDEVSC